MNIKILILINSKAQNSRIKKNLNLNLKKFMHPCYLVIFSVSSKTIYVPALRLFDTSVDTVAIPVLKYI